MRYGINTFLFTSPFTGHSTRLFPMFKRWGFDCVEIAVENPNHIRPAQVKRALDRHGLAAGPVCACFPPARDLRGTTGQQRAAVSYVRALMNHAVALDAPGVAGPLYSATGRADAVSRRDYARQWRTVVRHLKVLGRHAEDRGKFIYLEPLNRFETDFINTVDQALEMVADVDSPALKLLLDTFHLNIEEKCPARAIRKAGRHLGHLHACGTDRGTPGNDHLDWNAIARALASVRYAGDVVIESFTTDVKVIARAAAIWRRIEPDAATIAVKGLKFLQRTLKSSTLARVQCP